MFNSPSLSTPTLLLHVRTCYWQEKIHGGYINSIWTPDYISPRTYVGLFMYKTNAHSLHTPPFGTSVTLKLLAFIKVLDVILLPNWRAWHLQTPLIAAFESASLHSLNITGQRDIIFKFYLPPFFSTLEFLSSNRTTSFNRNSTWSLERARHCNGLK